MPFTGFLKTTSMPNTYSEIRYVNFDIQNKTIQFNIATWSDATKSQFINDLTYLVNSKDPFWDTYFEIFCPKNDLTAAIDDYLETKAEFAEATKTV